MKGIILSGKLDGKNFRLSVQLVVIMNTVHSICFPKLINVRVTEFPMHTNINAADDSSNTDLSTPTQHPQRQPKSVCSSTVLCIVLVLIGFGITMTVYWLWKPMIGTVIVYTDLYCACTIQTIFFSFIDRTFSLSKDVPATNVGSKDETELPSLDPNVNVKKGDNT